jgi:hypothetical protein
MVTGGAGDCEPETLLARHRQTFALSARSWNRCLPLVNIFLAVANPFLFLCEDWKLPHAQLVDQYHQRNPSRFHWFRAQMKASAPSVSRV